MAVSHGDLPERFGNWNTIYKNFDRRSKAGVWARVLEQVQAMAHQGGHRDAEFADSVAVADFYKHLHDWLNGPGQGAQILVVDNAPPPSADDDIVVRFSCRADQPPYGPDRRRSVLRILVSS